jgi:hypothetical protein
MAAPQQAHIDPAWVARLAAIRGPAPYVHTACQSDIDTPNRSQRTLGDEHPVTLARGVNVAIDLAALGRADEADRRLTDIQRALDNQQLPTIDAVQRRRCDCPVDIDIQDLRRCQQPLRSAGKD